MRLPQPECKIGLGSSGNTCSTSTMTPGPSPEHMGWNRIASLQTVAVSSHSYSSSTCQQQCLPTSFSAPISSYITPMRCSSSGSGNNFLVPRRIFTSKLSLHLQPFRFRIQYELDRRQPSTSLSWQTHQRSPQASEAAFRKSQKQAYLRECQTEPSENIIPELGIYTTISKTWS